MNLLYLYIVSSWSVFGLFLRIIWQSGKTWSEAATPTPFLLLNLGGLLPVESCHLFLIRRGCMWLRLQLFNVRMLVGQGPKRTTHATNFGQFSRNQTKFTVLWPTSVRLDQSYFSKQSPFHAEMFQLWTKSKARINPKSGKRFILNLSLSWNTRP